MAGMSYLMRGPSGGRYLIITVTCIVGIFLYFTTIFQSNFSDWGDLKQSSSTQNNLVPKESITNIQGSKAPIEITCRPQRHFVFIKTGKTGSSTLSSLLYRYGLEKNLVAALDPDKKSFINQDKNGNLIVKEYNCRNFPGYNFMASHIGYDRAAIDAVIDNAKYFTIIRSPYTHWKSGFYFSGHYKEFSNSSNPFLQYVNIQYERHREDQGVASVANGFCNRFGIPFEDDKQIMDRHLDRLDNEFDLVLLMEYYDESLILLKQLMCWDFRDILYYPLKVHTVYQPPTTPEMETKISQLARHDIRLYEYFNMTLWEKIRNYEGDFEADLVKFKTLQQTEYERCEGKENSRYCNLLKADTSELARLTLEMNTHQWSC
ncbi:galactosylceramide sulfotransferase-like [Ptychodera flava]|uniref:galactosylceramide sulfotransferase-like n=1 Tax=Ptychodera flava TaxID=63121 RepID=UPI00396A30C2